MGNLLLVHVAVGRLSANRFAKILGPEEEEVVEEVAQPENGKLESSVAEEDDDVLELVDDQDPNEIEEVVATCPGVLEVACIGVADEKSTEAVKIFVVKKCESFKN